MSDLDSPADSSAAIPTGPVGEGSADESLAERLVNSTEVPRNDVDAPPSVLARVKTIADTVSSVITALTATAAFVGSVWVVLEAFNLPDGLPRLDTSAFASLASAIAVAGVMFVAYCSLSVGGAGFAMRRWRKEKFKSNMPGFGETRMETTQILALLIVTAGISIWQAVRHDLPFWLLLVAIALPPALTFVVIPHETTENRFGILWRSILSTLVWFPSLFLLDILVLGASRFPHSPAMDVVVDVLFLITAASVNYMTAVAKPTAGIALGLAITLLAATLQPQVILGAPFRAVKLVDVTMRFPQPVVASDRELLANLLQACSGDIVVRFPSRLHTESYEVFVRQRIGQDLTVNCTPEGGTVTFPRALVTGTLPVASPTPVPLQSQPPSTGRAP